MDLLHIKNFGPKYSSYTNEQETADIHPAATFGQAHTLNYIFGQA